MNEHSDVKSASEGELAYAQQELLNLIYDEVSDLLVDQIKFSADIDELVKTPQQLTEVLETQIDHTNRIGSAAEMIGLHGLYKFCNHIRENFNFIKDNEPNLLLSLRAKILYWPDVVQTFLISPSDPDYMQLAMDFICQDELPIKLSAEDREDLKLQFRNSRIEVDEDNNRIHQATPELVSLEISDDIDNEIINGLLQDLPKLTEELSGSVDAFQNKEFLKQLEISERIAHTLKGASNTADIIGIANLTHHLESIFSALLKAKKRPSNELHRALMSATDCLQEMTEYLQGIGEFPSQAVQVLQEILNWSNKFDLHGVNFQVEAEESLDIKTSTSRIEPDNKDSIESEQQKNNLAIEPTLQISAKLVDDLLKRAGENIISNEQILELSVQANLALQRLSASNEKVRALSEDLENMIEISNFFPNKDSYSGNEKFDSLELDQFNELHTFANHLLESADDSVEHTHELKKALLKLEQLSSDQVRSLHENQEAVLRVRMVPVKIILPRLRRSVRQACRISERQVDLEVLGEETLIDSEYIYQLVDPLMHVLRNSIDHGIESSEERIKKGKQATGKIQLHFKKEGDHIRVMCQDDGNGLDMKSIKSKSIDLGLLNKNENLSVEQAINFILQHGFSTKHKVSQISGRGVGLAAVLDKIHDIKGSVNIETDSGEGC